MRRRPRLTSDHLLSLSMARRRRTLWPAKVGSRVQFRRPSTRRGSPPCSTWTDRGPPVAPTTGAHCGRPRFRFCQHFASRGPHASKERQATSLEHFPVDPRKPNLIAIYISRYIYKLFIQLLLLSLAKLFAWSLTSSTLECNGTVIGKTRRSSPREPLKHFESSHGICRCPPC